MASFRMNMGPHFLTSTFNRNKRLSGFKPMDPAFRN